MLHRKKLGSHSFHSSKAHKMKSLIIILDNHTWFRGCSCLLPPFFFIFFYIFFFLSRSSITSESNVWQTVYINILYGFFSESKHYDTKHVLKSWPTQGTNGVQVVPILSTFHGPLNLAILTLIIYTFSNIFQNHKLFHNKKVQRFTFWEIQQWYMQFIQLKLS